MWSARLGLSACLFTAVALSAPLAHSDSIVLDTCMRKCDADDLRVISLMRSALAARAKESRAIADVREVLGQSRFSLPLPTVQDPRLTSVELTKRLKAGIDDWVGGRYESAANQLEQVLMTAVANPALILSDPTLRQLIPRGQLGRAISLQRSKEAKDAEAAIRVEKLASKEAKTIKTAKDAKAGKVAKVEIAPEAKAAIAELVRTIPDESILDRWGPEAEPIYQAARRDLVARGMGTLIVKVDDPSAIFYVNESGDTYRSTLSRKALPGAYRILVQDARGRSRYYWRSVIQGDETVLDIKWNRDAQFEVVTAPNEGTPRIGFTYTSEAERANEPQYASEFGTQAGKSEIIVIRKAESKGSPVMLGTVYNADNGAVIRSGFAPLSADLEAANDLAMFLLTPETSTPLVTRLAGAGESLPRKRRSKFLAFVGIELGVLGIATVGVTAITDYTGTASSTEARIGYIAGGIGAIAGIATLVYYYRQPASRGNSRISLQPSRSGLSAHVEWRF